MNSLKAVRISEGICWVGAKDWNVRDFRGYKTPRHVAIGLPVLNTNILPTMAGFLAYMEGLKPRNKTGFVFGSYGWADQGLKKITDIVGGLSWNMPSGPFFVHYRPDNDALASLKK